MKLCRCIDQLKTLKDRESAPHEMDVAPHNTSRERPRAGLSSWSIESALIAWIKPATTSQVVPDEQQWKLGGIDLDDWSNEEVVSGDDQFSLTEPP